MALIHRAVWKDDLDAIRKELEFESKDEEKKKELFNEKDLKGNTPLMLAIFLRRERIVDYLLDHDDIVDVSIANERGFRAFDSALFTSNEKIIKKVAHSTTKYVHNSWEKRLEPVLQKLNEMSDMRGCLAWNFKSFVPFLSRLLPSDEYRFYKRGDAMRIDATLTEFEGMKWHRGKLSYLYTGMSDPKYPNELVLMDHDRKEVFRLLQKEMLPPSDEEMTEWLSYKTVTETDLISSKMEFQQKLNWWWGPKTDVVGGKWNAKEFDMTGLIIKFVNTVYPHVTRYAKEVGFDILLEEAEGGDEFAKEKAEEFGKIIKEKDRQRRGEDGIVNKKLDVDPQEEVGGDIVEVFGYTYDQYFGGAKGEKIEINIEDGIPATELELRRPPADQRMLYTQSSSTAKTLSASFWFSNDFPVSPRDIFFIARKAAPTDAVIRRIANIEAGMPLEEGFPVKFEIPVFGAALTGSAEFTECVLCDIEEKEVRIPDDYEWKQERMCHREYELRLEENGEKRNA